MKGIIINEARANRKRLLIRSLYVILDWLCAVRERAKS